MTKYNILWLDDEPIKALPDIREANPDIQFDTVNYVDICELIIENEPERYHAVILDANGIKADSPDIKANKSGFLSLVKRVMEQNILVYIYSGQLMRADEGDQADMALEVLNSFGLKDDEQIFYKSEGPYRMIDKIIGDLNGKYQYYVGREYLLQFFSNGWIDADYKTEFLDPIMEYYFKKDIDSAHGNQMRNLTEKMLERINHEFQLDTTTKAGDKSRYSKIAEAIKYKKLDFSHAIVGPLKHMVDLTNARSHASISMEDRQLFFESDFSTFFIVTKWFHKLMSCTEDVSLTESDDDSETIESEQSGMNVKSQKRKRKARTHEDEQTGVVVSTYVENGQTYCDLKVEIPDKWKNFSQLKITGVRPNNNPQDGVWYPFCLEP